MSDHHRLNFLSSPFVFYEKQRPKTKKKKRENNHRNLTRVTNEVVRESIVWGLEVNEHKFIYIDLEIRLGSSTITDLEFSPST